MRSSPVAARRPKDATIQAAEADMVILIEGCVRWTWVYHQLRENRVASLAAKRATCDRSVAIAEMVGTDLAGDHLRCRCTC